MKKLVLQGACPGGHDHPPARQQRRNEIGESLAGTGARLRHQPPTTSQRISHRPCHGHLGTARAKAGQSPGKRPDGPENFIEVKHLADFLMLPRDQPTGSQYRSLARQQIRGNGAILAGFLFHLLSRKVTQMATAPSSFKPLPEISPEVAEWVSEVASLTTPDRIHWFDGSAAETARLRKELLANQELTALNPETFPDCYLARSHPSDVARVEHLTIICTTNRDDAGPNNHWMAPGEAHQKMDALFKGCMK